MAKIEIFQSLREQVAADTGKKLPAEQRAMYWFRQHTGALLQWQAHHQKMSFTQLKNAKFTKQFVMANHALPGFFYFYMYDAKHKDTLPYWDKFPFTLVLDISQDRFMGLNFHYLDYGTRARLFDGLYEFRIGRDSRPNVRDIRMRIKMSYDLLKASSKYKAFRPCLKEYLIEQVETPLMKVGAKEWDLALFLPVQQFQKKDATYVWRQSTKQIT
jgi:hypothetical protein